MPQVLIPATVMRMIYGFTLGLYLFIYPLTFQNMFGTGVDGRFLLGAVFVFDFIIEALLDPPLGAYADIKGYKPTLKGAFLFRAMFFLGLVATVLLANSRHPAIGFPVAFLTQALFAVAYTLWSGTNSAWLYESLAESGQQDEYAKYFSHIQTGYYVCYIGGAILSAYLYFATLSALAYTIGAILSLLGVVYIHFFVKEPRAKERESYKRHVLDILADAYRYCISSKEIYHVLQLGGFFALVMHAVNYLWPPYAKDLLGIHSLDWRWISVVIVMTLGSLLGNIYIGSRWKKDNERREWKHYIWCCYCFGTPILLLAVLAIAGYNQFLPFVVLIAVGRVAVGAKDAPYEALMNDMISSATKIERTRRPSTQIRATILSSASMFNAILVLFFFIPTTVFGEKNTVKGWILPAILLIAATIVTNKKGYHGDRSNR